MSSATLFWYDLETTGVHSVHDRALQFAGQRTDGSLNPVGAPVQLFCMPAADTVPDPDALLITGIRLGDLAAKGLKEADFARELLRHLARPETCVAGYNNIRFDDEFVRQLLYRNLHDPYAREWQGGNSRWDAIGLVRAAYALRPAGLAWPRREDGAPSFRLEELAAANGIEHGAPHDALSDVHATIALVRLLRSAQPRLHDYLFSLRDKRRVLEQLYPLGKAPVVHVSSIYPAAAGCLALALPLCQHPHNKNGIICCNLAADPGTLMEASAKELRELLFAKRDARAPGSARPALHVLQVNRCPTVAPLATLTEADAARHGLDLDLCHAHFQRIKASSGLTEKIQEVYGGASRDRPKDPDAMLYSGSFFSDDDRATMNLLHQAPPEELAAFAGRFHDPRMDELLFRYRARNFPHTLTRGEKGKWTRFRRHRYQRLRSPDAALARIAELRAGQRTPADLAVLADLATYLQAL